MSEIIPFKRPTGPQELVLRFMHSVGHKQDAEFYLKLFTSARPESFSLIVLEEEILREELDAVLFEIRYLMRLNLFPVVLIRSSNDFMEKLEIEAYFKKAKIALNILSDTYSDDEKLEFIKARIRKGQLPLLHLDPELDLVQEVGKLANILQTGKVIFLRRGGGISHPQTGVPISIINLRFERDALLKNPDLSMQDAELLRLCDRLVNGCGHKIYVSLVSPNNLLRELFTVKGAGTLIQLGSKINTFHDWQGIDPRSLKRLLEVSFDGRIRDAFFDERFDPIYIEENYMGSALLKPHGDMAYLSKFAVGTEARGLGIGRDLWREITQNHRRVFWRSRPEKFISQWYAKQCDGMHRMGNWIVFWKGIAPDEIRDAVTFALEQPEDIIPSSV